MEKTTIFGAIETNHPKLYAKPVYAKDVTVNIIEIDAQYCLHSILDDRMFNSRDHLYALISGSLEPDMITENSLFASYRRLFISYYKRFKAFTNMVDTEYYFGDKDNLIPATVKPLQQEVNNYIKSLNSKFESMKKVSVLMVTHNYMYVGFRTPIPQDILDMPNVRVISDAD